MLGYADLAFTSSINLATNAECSSKNLLDRAFQLLRKRLESHCAGNLDDLVKGNRFAVLDILLLLTVAGRLLQCSDNEG